jgi:MFS family permease
MKVQPGVLGLSPRADERRPTLGLRANWRQFWLLVLVNAFVGSMVGLERTVLPLLAEREFGLASASAVLSFIVTFGLVKAITNFAAGRLGDRFGRKHILIAGWLAGIPVPLLVMWAPTWSWVVAANALLGINQGLSWSTTVIMKIDLVGPARRGLAMGLNECAGYLAVALAAFATGVVASRYGLRPAPFYLGIAFAVTGLALSLFAVRDTMAHVRHESVISRVASGARATHAGAASPGLRELVARVSWRDPALSTASQAGFINNLNDGLAWGLFPLFFAASGLSLRQIGILVAVYPATWGVVQLGTGALSDHVGRKGLVAWGMLLQGAALAAIALARGFMPWLVTGVFLGIGTAMVYPTLLAVIGDVAPPLWRGSAVGIYRFWRDLGYAAGAVVAGVLADAYGIPVAIAAVGALTAGSGLLVAIRMPETLAAKRVLSKGRRS